MAYRKAFAMQKQRSVVKLWGASTNAQMGVEMPMTWKNPCAAHWINWWIKDSTNQWTSASILESSSESMNQRNNDSVNQWSSDPLNQGINESISEWFNVSMSQCIINGSMFQWVDASMNHRIIESMNQWISESTNQRTNEWMVQRFSESMSQWISESMKQWINKSLVQGVSESQSQWINESVNQWINAWVSEGVNEWMNERTNEWMNQWTIEPRNQGTNESMNFANLILQKCSDPPQFFAILKCKSQAGAHFADLNFHNCSNILNFFAVLKCNTNSLKWALATFSCTFCRPHLPKVFRSPQFFCNFGMQNKFIEMQIELSLHSCAHFANLIFQKCSDRFSFLRLSCETELSLHSRARLADLIFEKSSELDSFFWTFWRENRTLATDWGRLRPNPRKQRPSIGDHGSHFTRKSTRFRVQECFHPWIRTLPNCYTSQLLDDGWLTWWCGWHGGGHADHDNRP